MVVCILVIMAGADWEGIELGKFMAVIYDCRRENETDFHFHIIVSLKKRSILSGYRLVVVYQGRV